MTAAKTAPAATKKRAPRKKVAPKKETPVVETPAVPVFDIAVNRQALLSALDLVGKAIRTHGAIPAMTGVRLSVASDRLTLTGSDLDQSIRTTIPVTSTGQNGTILVPGRLLSAPLKNLDAEDVTLNQVAKGDHVTVRCGDYVGAIRPFDVDEYPKLAWPDIKSMTLPADCFNDVEFVAGAASLDQARPILTGVLIEALDGQCRLAATDSYRLATADLPVAAPDKPMLVQAKTVALAVRYARSNGFDEVTVLTGDRMVGFVAGETMIAGISIEGDFPNYKGLVPDKLPYLVGMSRRALLGAVNLVTSVSTEATPVRLRVDEPGVQKLSVNIHEQDVGEFTHVIDAQVDAAGNDCHILFNGDYLRYALKAGDDDVTVTFTDHIKPALISVSDRVMYLLMPVRGR